MDNTTAGDGCSRDNYFINAKIALFSVIVMFMAVIFILCFHSYSRWFSHRHRSRRRNSLLPLFNHDASSGSDSISSQGLDLFTLKKLSVFTFSSVIHDQLPECAVCLSEFQNDENGRVLPNCNHAFHVQCIDMWFHSHSNCPICRAPVKSPEKSVATVVPADQPELGTGSDETDQNKESDSGSSASSRQDQR